MDSWPIDTNDIIDILNGNETIDSSLIRWLPTNNVGMYALEYLLFSSHLEKNHRYQEFLHELVENFNLNVQSMQEVVNISKEDFVSSEGYSYSSTVGSVLNQIAAICQDVSYNKIGVPIGYYENISMDDKMLEAWKSKTSHVIINTTLKNLKNVFYGANNGEGLEEFLKYEGKDNLISKADEYFLEADKLYNELTNPLVGNLEANEEILTKLMLSFKNIRHLIVVEIAPELGFVIGFSDSDGD